MTIIEKIKAEIERLKKAQEVSEDKDYAQYELDVACGYDMACDDILSFLSALEPEKPIIPKDLEEAAKRYSNNKHPMTPTGARESQEDFIAGAKWDREQIMKNAKDGWIDEECVIVLNDGTRIDLQPDYEKNPAFEFEYAQDVQVIVLPKED